MDEFNRTIDARLDKVLSAIRNGLVVVDGAGQIIWIDEATRRSINGGLERLAVLPQDGEPVLRYALSTIDLDLNGKNKTVCVMREISDQPDTTRDIVAAIEAIMSDSGWFAQAIIEKVRAWRQSRQPTKPAAELGVLTDREREILALICEGRSDAEMSKMLGLSQNTIRNHVASLYRKIGVNRRSAAIIWARERAITRYELKLAKGRHVRDRHPD
jgi:DNA-binding CsgD family transcriptional regulator